MLTDPDGLALLDLKKTKSAWKDYADEAIDHYRFGYDLFEMADRVKLKRAMEAAKEEKTKREYAVQISRLNRRIEAIRQQDEQAREILAEQLAMLEAYFDEYEQDIAQYRKQLERRRRNQAPQIVEVASLRGQADRIEADLRKDRAELLAPLNTLWDDYERAITWLDREHERRRRGRALARPGDRHPADPGAVYAAHVDCGGCVSGFNHDHAVAGLDRRAAHLLPVQLDARAAGAGRHRGGPLGRTRLFLQRDLQPLLPLANFDRCANVTAR
jgi:hypothetical protein